MNLRARVERIEASGKAEVQCVFVGREPTALELATLAEQGLPCVSLPDNHRGDYQEPSHEQS